MLNVEQQLDAVQTAALLVPLGAATLIVTGKDRLSWLNGLVTCELLGRTPGAAVFGLLVQKNGKLESEAFVLVEQDRVLVSLREEAKQAIFENLDRHLVMEDCEIELSADFRWHLALGARAQEVATVSSANGATSGTTVRGGLPCGVVCSVASETAAVIAACIEQVPASATCSLEGWHRVRVEHGIGEWGVDFDDTNYPQEAALEHEGVSFSKGCYLGQEAVFMLQNRGHVKKRLVQLMFPEGAAGVAAGATIENEAGATIGHITSFVARGGRDLALGYVKYKSARADTPVRVCGNAASVTSLLALSID